MTTPARTPVPVRISVDYFLFMFTVAQLLLTFCVPQNASFPNVLIAPKFRKLPMFGQDASEDTCGFLSEWICQFETAGKSETGYVSRAGQK